MRMSLFCVEEELTKLQDLISLDKKSAVRDDSKKLLIAAEFVIWIFLVFNKKPIKLDKMIENIIIEIIISIRVKDFLFIS